MRPRDPFANLHVGWKFAIFMASGLAWFPIIDALEHRFAPTFAHGLAYGWLIFLASVAVLASLAYYLLAPVGRRATLAEHRLTDAEARARTILANISDAVFVHDLNGRLLEVNEPACQYLGHDREQLLTMSIADIAVDTDHHDRAARWRAMPTDTTFTFKSVHRSKSGRLVPVEVRLCKLTETNRQVIVALTSPTWAPLQSALQRLVEGTAQVTGRAFFDALAALLPDVFAVRYAWIGRLDQRDPDLVHALAAWNGEAVIAADYRLAGTPCEEALGMTASFHPVQVRKHFRHVAPFPLGRASSYFGVPLRDANGEAIGILALLDDKVMETDPDRLIILNSLAGRVVAELNRLDADLALAASEEKYRRLMELANDAIVVADADTGLIVSVNQQAQRLLGRPGESLVGRHQSDLHPAAERERYRDIFRHHIAKGGVVRDMRVVRADGEQVPVDIGAATIEVGGQRLALGIFRDVTDRHYIEEAFRAINASLEAQVRDRTAQLTQANARLSGIIETAMDAIVSVDEAHHIVLFNPAAEKLFQVSKADAMGKNLDSLLPEPSRAMHHRQVREFGETGASLRGMGHLGAIYARRADGQTFPADIAISALQTQSGRIYTSVIRDISERVEAERRRRLDEERMCGLTSHLQSVREEERARIANEIHDELGGLLTGIKMDLRFLAKRLPADQGSAQDKLTELTALTESAIQTVRKISTDLRPSVLDNLGLLPAIEWQAKEFQRRMDIKCQLSIDAPDLELTGDQTTAIFRIIQESLTNVARHAQASRVRLSVERLDDELIVSIRDDGVGIEPNAILSINSFGLLGMFERARQFGGTVTITGSPAQGTLVSLVFPLATTMAAPASGSEILDNGPT